MNFEEALVSVLKELYGDQVKYPLHDTATLTMKTVRKALERMK